MKMNFDKHHTAKLLEFYKRETKYGLKIGKKVEEWKDKPIIAADLTR